MVTVEQPPAYTADQGPAPAYGVQQPDEAGKDTAPPPAYGVGIEPGKTERTTTVYWVYWGFMFGTFLTWIFAVAAAADDAWISHEGLGTYLALEEDICGDFASDSFWSFDDEDEVCDLFTAAKAFQYMATILVSVALILVVVAAFMKPPRTGQVGLSVGIILAVFAVFQLIAFACMAEMISKYSDWWLDDVKDGPTLAVAVVSWLLGTVGAVVILILRPRASTDQDGPLVVCVPNASGPPAGGPHAVGHV